MVIVIVAAIVCAFNIMAAITNLFTYKQYKADWIPVIAYIVCAAFWFGITVLVLGKYLLL